ncbi:MAG: DUF302 domain-containing protein [Actinomycetota bacterium]
MEYGRTIAVGLAYDEAVSRVKEAFQEQGFGTLTEVDVRATLKEKLDEETEPYTILGFCNPELAHRALAVEPEIGLLLPCNVVVRQHDDQTLVHALDAGVMVRITERPELEPIAEEAARRIDQAIDSLSGLGSRRAD